ncbi:SUMF1/EgtB/PvdO family nonheme iron enzyme [Nonomuraea jabiensis]|uniref:SUMF1/EgtB/PvdO family nonheme iron enzyme n=1 Tax=Nonomuraea jabiensis TaxID=882448 RepID=UPI00368CF5C1
MDLSDMQTELDFDPATVTSEDALKRLQVELYTISGRSVRQIHRPVEYEMSRSQTHKIASGAVVPSKLHLQAFVVGCGVPPDGIAQWMHAWENVARAKLIARSGTSVATLLPTSMQDEATADSTVLPELPTAEVLAPEPAAPSRSFRNGAGSMPGIHRSQAAHLRIALDKWVIEFDQPRTGTHAEKDPQKSLGPSELILRGQGPVQSDEGLSALPSTLGRLTESGMTAELVTAFRGLSIPVRSATDFWAVLAADMTLYRARPGDLQWLVKQTGQILMDPSSNLEVVRRTWEVLFEEFLREHDAGASAWPLESIFDHFAQWAGTHADRFHVFMRWLQQVVPHDLSLWSAIHHAVEAHEQRLPAKTAWDMRVVVRKAKSLVSHRLTPSPAAFQTRIVPIPKIDGVCPYDFEAMCFPLKNEEAATVLQGRSLRLPALEEPYIIDLPRTGSRSTEAELRAFLHELIMGCVELDRDSPWVWAVPTPAEWLALAGCATLDKHYPWGPERPTPNRANLYYGGRRTDYQAEPVGSRPSGASPHGVHDCCGNVHELVEWRVDGTRLGDFRLAGGCFSSSPKWSYSTHFRPLIPHPRSRRNVGIRLIRYDPTHTNLRKSAARTIVKKLDTELATNATEIGAPA